MKNLMYIIFIALCTLSCTDTTVVNDIDLNTGTRSSKSSAYIQEALDMQYQFDFLNIETKNGLKSSNLGNGKYWSYLKVTFRLTNKLLYQQETLEARQVCLREMMHTHYAYSKEEVIDEIAKILAGDMLIEPEKKQVNVFLEKIVLGVYQDMAIQFNCETPGQCLS